MAGMVLEFVRDGNLKATFNRVGKKVVQRDIVVGKSPIPGNGNNPVAHPAKEGVKEKESRVPPVKITTTPTAADVRAWTKVSNWCSYWYLVFWYWHLGFWY